MTPEESTDFADPKMKAVVHRCWACEKAPDALRIQIERLLESRAATRSIGPRWLWPLAMAATIALAVGLKSLFHPGSLSSVPAVQIASLLPASLQDNLIATHDRCAQKPDHHRLPVPRDDDAAIAQNMRTRLSQAVLVARPDEPGWTFRGAAVCRVGLTPTGHLVFAKDADAISIFSLPQSLAPGIKDGSHFEMTTAGHPIVAFAKDGALFCIVGSGPAGTISLNELTEMRQHMEAGVTAASSPIEPRTTIAELLYTPGMGKW